MCFAERSHTPTLHGKLVWRFGRKKKEPYVSVTLKLLSLTSSTLGNLSAHCLELVHPTRIAASKAFFFFFFFFYVEERLRQDAFSYSPRHRSTPELRRVWKNGEENCSQIAISCWILVPALSCVCNLCFLCGLFIVMHVATIPESSSAVSTGLPACVYRISGSSY